MFVKVLHRLLVTGCALTICSLVAIPAQAADAAAETLAAASNKFRDELSSLAAKCDELGLPEQAKLTRDWFLVRNSQRQTFCVPPSFDRDKPAPSAPPLVKKWHERFMLHRAAYADALLVAAQAAMSQRQPAIAYQLLHDLLRENPDQADARRILGFNKVGTEWRVAAKDAKPSAPRFDHPDWHWKRGQFWKVDSEHFQIVSNHSAKAVADLADQLEDLHTVWRQMFFRFWCDSEALAQRFAGANVPLGKLRQHDVVLFRDRQEYVLALRRDLPQIEQTLGLYSDKRRSSYFYAGDDAAHATWFHEATHQLWQETLDLATAPGESANIWAVEAVALYMESFQRHRGFCSVGGWDADRLQFQRYRTLRGDTYTPLEKLVALNRDSLQRDPEIRRLYGQAAGLAHLMLDGQNGRYREPFVDYLTTIYLRRDNVGTLAQLAKTNLADLDQQYREYLQGVGDDALRSTVPAPRIKNLCLGQTAVTDRGLQHWSQVNSLEWLDLSATATTDAGLAAFRHCSRLKQLFLERTAVTDASAALLGSFKNLEELDLSGTQITDAGLRQLNSLKELKKLYLTNCAVTDAGLDALKNLRQLDELETTGTQITADGVARLRRSSPKLPPPAR